MIILIWQFIREPLAQTQHLVFNVPHFTAGLTKGENGRVASSDLRHPAAERTSRACERLPDLCVGRKESHENTLQATGIGLLRSELKYKLWDDGAGK